MIRTLKQEIADIDYPPDSLPGEQRAYIAVHRKLHSAFDCIVVANAERRRTNEYLVRICSRHLRSKVPHAGGFFTAHFGKKSPVPTGIFSPSWWTVSVDQAVRKNV